ncbi:hypothetical protein ACJX0J_041450 [Zea mays]
MKNLTRNGSQSFFLYMIPAVIGSFNLGRDENVWKHSFNLLIMFASSRSVGGRRVFQVWFREIAAVGYSFIKKRVFLYYRTIPDIQAHSILVQAYGALPDNNQGTTVEINTTDIFTIGIRHLRWLDMKHGMPQQNLQILSVYQGSLDNDMFEASFISSWKMHPFWHAHVFQESSNLLETVIM